MSKHFKWEEKENWTTGILEMLKDILTPKVIQLFKKNPPEYIVSDDLGWLDEIIDRAGESNCRDIKTEATSRMLKQYSHVIAYHGCRPESLEPYLSKGLLPSNIEALKKRAKEIFGASPELEVAITDLDTPNLGASYAQHNSGKTFFCLEMKELVEGCGHYLLYGSEYLACVGVRVGDRERLRSVGKATILECQIPKRMIDQGTWNALAGETLESIFERIRDPDYYGGSVNFGFFIKESLPPSAIKKIHHPTRIPNPLMFRIRED